MTFRLTRQFGEYIEKMDCTEKNRRYDLLVKLRIMLPY